MTFFNYLVEQFSIHSNLLPRAFSSISSHELNQHFTAIHALYMTNLNFKDFSDMSDLGWAYYPIPDKGNNFKNIADGFFYNRITNDFITMQFKYRITDSLMYPHQRDIHNLILNYHPTSHFIEVGFSKHLIYQRQVDIFNIYNPSRHIILRDYSQRYGIISEIDKKMIDNVFCWYINYFNHEDYMKALLNYHDHIKPLQSVHIPKCACELDSYQISETINLYSTASFKQHLVQNLTGLPLDQCK